MKKWGPWGPDSPWKLPQKVSAITQVNICDILGLATNITNFELKKQVTKLTSRIDGIRQVMAMTMQQPCPVYCLASEDSEGWYQITQHMFVVRRHALRKQLVQDLVTKLLPIS